MSVGVTKPSATVGPTTAIRRYQSDVKARTVSATTALGWAHATWVVTAKEMGPVQSWGANPTP